MLIVSRQHTGEVVDNAGTCSSPAQDAELLDLLAAEVTELRAGPPTR